jgi:hypothetical protein
VKRYEKGFVLRIDMRESSVLANHIVR